MLIFFLRLFAPVSHQSKSCVESSLKHSAVAVSIPLLVVVVYLAVYLECVVDGIAVVVDFVVVEHSVLIGHHTVAACCCDGNNSGKTSRENADA